MHFETPNINIRPKTSLADCHNACSTLCYIVLSCPTASSSHRSFVRLLRSILSLLQSVSGNLSTQIRFFARSRLVHHCQDRAGIACLSTRPPLVKSRLNHFLIKLPFSVNADQAIRMLFHGPQRCADHFVTRLRALSSFLHFHFHFYFTSLAIHINKCRYSITFYRIRFFFSRPDARLLLHMPRSLDDLIYRPPHGYTSCSYHF